MKKAVLTIIILALLGAGGYGAYYYVNVYSVTTGTRVSSSSEDAVYVETVSSLMGYGTGTGVVQRYSGEVEAQATLEVKLDSDRTLDECYVEVGDIVEEGQALFSYDTQEEEDQIAQDEIDIEKNQMQITSNETEIASQEKLMASTTDEDEVAQISINILQLQNENRSLEYEIQSKQLEIESLEETIEDSVVTAEMAGYVQKISDTEDTESYYSSSESSAYITILAEGDYRVNCTVNELNYNDIYEGMSVIVYSRVDSSLTWTGTISEISTEQAEEDTDSYYYYGTSSDTSSYTFYVELDNSDGLLLGQHVYVEEDTGQTEEKSGIWLDEFHIVFEDDGSAYVWLANTSNVIEKRTVTLGEYDEELAEYEILDGLELDDYIAYPSGTISEGDPVYYYDIAVVDDSSYDDDEYYDADADGEYYDADGDEEYYDADDEEYYDADADEEYYIDDEEEYYIADDEEDDMIYDADEGVYYSLDDIEEGVDEEGDGEILYEDDGL